MSYRANKNFPKKFSSSPVHVQIGRVEREPSRLTFPAALVFLTVNRCRRRKRLPALPSRLDLLRPLALSGHFQP